jgi:hypothetical protein
MGSMWVDPVNPNDYVKQEGVPFTTFDTSLLRDPDRFPTSRWGADFLSLAAATEFTKNFDPGKISYTRYPPPGSSQFRQEINDLITLQNTRRAAALSEIVAQNDNFQQYFLGLLTTNARSRSKTYLLLKIAARVSETLMSVYKVIENRPRPSQYYPPLAPPLDVADHSSFPSGHALGAHLMAFCASEGAPHARIPLARLAHRIARNREIAGFHFRSDTTAGQEIASQALKILKRCPIFQQTIAGARAE